jgi:hypothetical protein
MSESSQRWIAIGVGLAAIATAGFLIFRSSKGERAETEDEEVLRVHFVSADLSQAELDKLIEKWTDDQVKALLKDAPNNVL